MLASVLRILFWILVFSSLLFPCGFLAELLRLLCRGLRGPVPSDVLLLQNIPQGSRREHARTLRRAPTRPPPIKQMWYKSSCIQTRPLQKARVWLQYSEGDRALMLEPDKHKRYPTGVVSCRLVERRMLMRSTGAQSESGDSRACNG